MLLSVANARQRMMEALRVVGRESVTIDKAAGRVLGRDVAATIPSPQFTNSSMDGFALHAHESSSASLDNPVEFRIVDDIPAGTSKAAKIGPGEAARIMTGAPLPEGVDAVIPVEDTDFNESKASLPESVEVYKEVSKGDFVRPLGEDFKKGQVLLKEGQRLRPQDVGILAMVGHADIEVYKRPVIGIMSTGDELLPVGQELQPGKIRDSNSHTIAALVGTCGCDVQMAGIVPDNEREITQALDKLVKGKVDLIVSSAGVSVGVYDYVRKVVEEKGKLNFWRVNMRPGKPLAFGQYSGIPFVGLPGNPVSSFVGFEVFLRPVLNWIGGDVFWKRRVHKAILEEDIHSDGRESFFRASLEYKKNTLYARLTGHQGSGNLYSLVQANGLINLPAGVQSIHAGHEVDAWFLT